MMLLFIHCFSIFPYCIFEENTVKTNNFGRIWLSLITTSLYTWQRSLCDRNRLNEPAKAFLYHSGERIVRDFSCALGISSPVGIFLSKCSGIRLSVQYRAFFGKRRFPGLSGVEKMSRFCLVYCFHLNTKVKLIFISQVFFVTSLT